MFVQALFGLCFNAIDRTMPCCFFAQVDGVLAELEQLGVVEEQLSTIREVLEGGFSNSMLEFIYGACSRRAWTGDEAKGFIELARKGVTVMNAGGIGQ